MAIYCIGTWCWYTHLLIIIIYNSIIIYCIFFIRMHKYYYCIIGNINNIILLGTRNTHSAHDTRYKLYK